MGERENIPTETPDRGQATDIPAEAAPKRALPAIHAGASIRALVPTSLDDAFRIAKYVALGGHLPKDMKSAEQIMVAIMHGLEIGLPPMQAIQSIAVINGRPVVWGDAAMALVRSSGLVEFIKEFEEGTPYEDSFQAVCVAKRKGDPMEVRSAFAVADAKLAGLWMKRGYNGQDTPWVTYPRRMLKMRARAFTLRDLFADVLRGLAIREEQEDVPMRDVTPAADPSYNPLKPTLPVPSSPSGGQTGPSDAVQTADGAASGDDHAGAAQSSSEDEPA